ncbi:PIR Superfamily Protein [Plasmodium ovale curtisi]|uniref:PIR Superfamily Protein n=1 Tax=Plasmodium ovale curtisi TaxID=864141 RepID=A0A1A8X6D3_PLAOA|nr:PIR Superfamily Protein [Plasmodium ovale curtisi]
MTTGEPDYDIFENSEDYFKKEALIDHIPHPYDANFCYISENSNFKPNYSLMKLCKNFVIFLEKLQTEYPNDTTKYSKYREYLNFWLTYKLTSTGQSDNYITEFYKFMQNNYKAFPPDGELKRKIYHIKGKSFNNMSILYDLYRLYYEIKHKSLEKCEKFHKKFMENYNLGISKCYTAEEKLCTPLEKFKQFYDINRSSRLHMCSTQGLPELPKFVTPNPSNGTNFIDKFSYHLSQLSKKQTKETHSVISNTVYPNLVTLLSLNYNLLLQDTEHKKKEIMVEILYEFIKFCKERSTITLLDSLIERFSNGFYEKKKSNVPFINSFIKEFFRDFYENEKGEYELIYEECSTKNSQASYCSKYKMCNEKLGQDLHKIKNNIRTYLEYKETPAQQLAPQLVKSLDPQYSSSETPLYVEDEDNSSSNSTPINVGIGVGALFTLSFLYKFTPIGSWVNRTFLGRGNTMYNYEEENGQDFFDHNSGFDSYLSENQKFNVAYGAS